MWEFGQCVNGTEHCDGVGYELKKSMDFVHDICESAGVFLSKESFLSSNRGPLNQ